jgi:hypothetical protein
MWNHYVLNKKEKGVSQRSFLNRRQHLSVAPEFCGAIECWWARSPVPEVRTDECQGHGDRIRSIPLYQVGIALSKSLYGTILKIWFLSLWSQDLDENTLVKWDELTKSCDFSVWPEIAINHPCAKRMPLCSRRIDLRDTQQCVVNDRCTFETP